MRRVQNISFPHPVLRNGSTDYPRGSFDGCPILDVLPDASLISLRVEFVLDGCPDLAELVIGGRAAYCVLVKCERTYYRKILFAEGKTIDADLGRGSLDGEIEVLPLLVTRRGITGYRSREFHGDYEERTFDLEPGSVLAMGKFRTYYIDTTFLRPISSVFRIDFKSMEGMIFKYDISGDLITIFMSEKIKKEFDANKAHGKRLGVFLAGVYLPVLVSVLRDLDADPEEYSGRRWEQAIRETLRKHDLRSPEENADASDDRLFDAQTILRNPLRHVLVRGD